MKVLAGDIGGTNSRLAIFEGAANGLSLRTHETYASSEYACVADIVSRFLEAHHAHCELVCLGLPGPVPAAGLIQLTNLPWRVDREELRRAARTHAVTLINDVQAAAAGVHHLAADTMRRLHDGQPDATGMRTVISVGTGLGVAGLLATGEAFATEAGHASFAPRSDFDVAFLRSLQREHGHVSWERVASGMAIPRIYAQLAPAGAPELDAAEIVSRASADPLCRRTMDSFASYLGAAAGNIALTMMPAGGIYFCGGVAPRVIDACGAKAILEALVDKGRMRAVLQRIPVYLVADDTIALTGAAYTALANVDGR